VDDAIVGRRQSQVGAQLDTVGAAFLRGHCRLYRINACLEQY